LINAKCMFKNIIRFSLENKLIVGFGVLLLILAGLYSARQIPLDAVPDITNNQVQIVTTAGNYAPEEVEQLISYPLEAGMTNLPGVIELRSISRYGLSVITVVFEDRIDILRARQIVQEQLSVASEDLPSGVRPELMPITTGLGEIYQYVLTVDPAYAHVYDAMRLRTIQDWIVKRQLNGTKGIIETSSFGGFLKQYEVAVKADELKHYGLSLNDIIVALEKNNENSGASYIEKDNYAFYIRTEGRVESIEEIAAVPVGYLKGVPVTVKDVADIRLGSAKRYGAMTMDGKGEVVGGITLMLKGGNSSETLRNVTKRIEDIQNALPEGISIYPYLDRSKLINRTVSTATRNLVEGGAIVILVLLLLLGNLRAGLIVASVIPLSMLFALILMNYFGVSATLMSLGAIDFGIIIDGAVIIVEALLHTLALGYVGKRLSASEMDDVVLNSTASIYRSAAFGVLIILVVFVPILALDGIEGKTFRPMAQTLAFAIIGSLVLSVTYVPVMASLFLSKKVEKERGMSESIMRFLKKAYRPMLSGALRHGSSILVFAVLLFSISLYLFNRMGAEFIPTLEEGDIAMQQTIKPGSSLEESIKTTSLAEQILKDKFPEVEHVVSKIGTAEVPTDPMAIEDADVMIIMKDKKEWVSASTREALVSKMKRALEEIHWASYEFTQPIQLRFNELMTGSKSDISIKLFGEDVDRLKELADTMAVFISGIQGAADVKVDQTDGLQQFSIQYERRQLARYGIDVVDANRVVRAAFGGEVTGRIYEGERRFDLVVRLNPEDRSSLDLHELFIRTRTGYMIPLSLIARQDQKVSPMLISREQARRYINVGVNVRNRDVASIVEDIKASLSENIDLPPGFEIQYGGQYENLKNAQKRLAVAVPAALCLILLLLYIAFKNLKEVLIIFMAVPLSSIGGVFALLLRDMPFSISSGIGFIALFGISVLNGIVLINAVGRLYEGGQSALADAVVEGSLSRLRPVIMTAMVAAFGFVPMALSTGSGAEVQQPLATVVVGGLVSSTLLTLFVLPVLYFKFSKKQPMKATAVVLVFMTFGVSQMEAQSFSSFDDIYQYSLKNHPLLENQRLKVSQKILEKKAVGQLAPTEISYQGGQINYDGFDHFFNLDQSISALFGRSAERKLIDREAELMAYDRMVLMNELAFSIKSTLNEFYLVHAKYEIVDSIIAVYKRLSPRVKSQFENGERGKLDYRLLQYQLAKYEHEFTKLGRDKLALLTELRKMAFLPAESTVSPRDIELIPYNESAFIPDESIYIEAYQLKKDVLDQSLNVKKVMSRVPDIRLGVFMQSLEKDFNFRGVNVGVALPIDRRAYQASQAIHSIDTERVTNEKRGMVHKLMTEVRFLTDALDAQYRSLSAYDLTIGEMQTDILAMSESQFRNGQISVLDYIQVFDTLLNDRRTHIENLVEYNRAYLRLSYLTQKK